MQANIKHRQSQNMNVKLINCLTDDKLIGCTLWLLIFRCLFIIVVDYKDLRCVRYENMDGAHALADDVQKSCPDRALRSDQ